MKLTTHKREWIQKRLTHYCQLLQVEPPTLILTRKEYEAWKVSKRQEKLDSFKRLGITTIPKSYLRVGRTFGSYMGVCHRPDKMISINVKHSANLKSLDDTIRHELIHYAKPSYNHCSQIFLERMEALKKGHIKNGKF